jgi:adenylate cyclase
MAGARRHGAEGRNCGSHHSRRLERQRACRCALDPPSKPPFRASTSTPNSSNISFSGTKLARPDYAPGLEAILLVLGGLAAALVARFAKPITAATALLILIGGLALGNFLVFSHAGLLFDPLIPGATWILTYAAMTVAVYRRSERQRQFVRKAFSRYLAPALVERLAEDPSKLELGGEARDVTVFFADVCDFTLRSEGLSAVEVVQFLNSVHTPLTEAVLARSGTIDKYFGDGLMAFWNAPLDVAHHAEHACAAALALRAALPAINAQRAPRRK